MTAPRSADVRVTGRASSEEARRYFSALWPDSDGQPGQLVIWTRSSQGVAHIKWTSPEAAPREALALASDRDVYVTIQTHDLATSAEEWGLRHREAETPREDRHRGCKVSAMSIPGTWIDIDCQEGHHSATNLPTRDEALALIQDLPLAPTLIVASGGGLHVYWLFREPWVFEGANEREEAARLVAGWEDLVRTRFNDRVWHLDSVSDLARVLRVPGTSNHKRGKVAVRILHLAVNHRYNPDELLDAIRIHSPEPAPTSALGHDQDFRDADADLVLEKCSWLRSLRDAPESQTEPQWYAAISILGRCKDGRVETHEFSRGHAGYSKIETDRKLRQAVDRAGPRTCADIEEKLRGDSHCGSCEFRGKITSPIQLGRPDPRDVAERRLNEAIRASRGGASDALLDGVALEAAALLQREAPSRYAILETQAGKEIRRHGHRIATYREAIKKQGAEATGAGVQNNGSSVAEYENTPNGIVWNKPSDRGTQVIRLTNFQAVIESQVIKDNGLDEAGYLSVSVTLGNRQRTLQVPVSKFFGMRWPLKQLGPRAVVQPGIGTRDRAAVAIQTLSPDADERRVYTMTGWQAIGEDYAYLHGGGAIGPRGPLGPPEQVEVHLEGDVRGYSLSAPIQAGGLREALGEVLQLLELASDPVMAPIFAAVFRAPLGPNDFGIHLFGETGSGKTEVAALAQQFFGAEMDAQHLPGSWSSTANALEAICFIPRDSLVVIDDFVAGNTAADALGMHRKAERIFRALGNNAGRQRMTADASLRPTYFPRGTILSTGEENVQGQSIRARVLTIEIGKDELRFDLLSRSQEAARSETFSGFMASYVQYLAPRYGSLRAEMTQRVERLRGELGEQYAHRRTPTLAANLLLGVDWFLEFTLATTLLDEEQARAIRSRLETGIMEAVRRHDLRIGKVNPAERFMRYLRSALSSGRCHVADIHGEAPDGRESELGWRRSSSNTWEPRGDRVGWIPEGKGLYLDFESALGAAQAMARGVGDAITETPDTIKRRLRDGGLLLSTETRGGKLRLVVRRMVEGRRKGALHVRWDDLAESVAQVAQVAQPPTEEEVEDPDSRPGGPTGPHSSNEWPSKERPQESTESALTASREEDGPLGPPNPQEDNASPEWMIPLLGNGPLARPRHWPIGGPGEVRFVRMDDLGAAEVESAAGQPEADQASNCPPAPPSGRVRGVI